MEKAKNTLADAHLYFGNSSHISTVNRIYYALFYAVNGLLILKELSSSKHSGTLGLFNREIVNKGLIDKSYGKFLADMFDNRQEGDYKDFVTFAPEDIEAWLVKAEKFIETIEELIEKTIIDYQEKMSHQL